MITLRPNWRVRTIDNNFVLEEKRAVKKVDKETKKPTGEAVDKWLIMGYYSDVYAAFKGFLRHYTGNSTSVKEVLDKVQEVNDMFKEHLTLSREA